MSKRPYSPSFDYVPGSSQPPGGPAMGGVEGMCAEAEKCDPLCRMCHALDPSSTSSNERRCDPATFEFLLRPTPARGTLMHGTRARSTELSESV